MEKVEKNKNVDKYSSDISSVARQPRMALGSSRVTTGDYHSALN